MLTLTGLEEYTQYTIEISASTMVGAGPVSTSFVTTAAAGELWNSIYTYSLFGKMNSMLWLSLHDLKV